MRSKRNISWFLIVVIPAFLWARESPADLICEEQAEILYGFDIDNQPDQSIVAIQKLLPDLLAAECWENYVDGYNLLSVAYYYQRNYELAKKNAQQAVLMAEKYLGKELMYAAAIANLAFFVNGASSIALREESLQIERALGSEYDALVYAMEELGLSHQKIGDFDTAIAYFKQAIEVLKKEKIENSHEESRLLRQLASCYQPKNEGEEVFRHLKAAVAILDQLPPTKYFQQTRWYAYVDIARAFLSTTEIATAKKYIQKAIAIQQQSEVLEQYKSWLTYGDICLAEDNKEEALVGYQKAKMDAAQEYSYYQYHLGLAKPLVGVGKVHASEGKYDLALNAFAEALRASTFDFDPADFLENPPREALINTFFTWQVLEEKAKVLKAYYQSTNEQYLLEAAHATHLLAIELVHDIRLTYLAEGSKHVLLEKTHALYEEAIDGALELYEITSNEQYLADAFLFAESNKAVLLYESVKNRTAKNYAGIPDSLLKKEQGIAGELTFYKTKILEEKQQKKSGNQSLLKEWEGIAFQLKKDLEQQVQLMEKDFPVYATLKKQTEPLSLKQLQSALPDSKKAIVEFVVGEKKSYVFWITKNEQHVFPFLGKKDLQLAVDAMRQLLVTPPEDADQFKSDYLLFCRWSSDLYRQLLAPGLAALPPDIAHLLIVPDDVLNYLPFELLTPPIAEKKETALFYKDLPYLFKDYEVSYNYSASLSSVEQAATPAKKDLPAFYGFAPSFDSENIAASRSCNAEELYGLFCNKKEVEAIHEIWPGAIFTNQEATLAAFDKKASDHQILHLATHACIDEEEIELNKIFFSNKEYLTQSELNNKELNAALTVLSACNTGNGKLLAGEGVMSLARCFLMAGSKSVLTSLWSVDDCSTSAIMLEYYKNLEKGLGKDRAIAQAKQSYLAAADLSNSHPYYWAAFIQFGDVEALRVAEVNYWPYLLGGLCLLLLGFFRFK